MWDAPVERCSIAVIAAVYTAMQAQVYAVFRMFHLLDLTWKSQAAGLLPICSVESMLLFRTTCIVLDSNDSFMQGAGYGEGGAEMLQG